MKKASGATVCKVYTSFFTAAFGETELKEYDCQTGLKFLQKAKQFNDRAGKDNLVSVKRFEIATTNVEVRGVEQYGAHTSREMTIDNAIAQVKNKLS